MDGQERAFQKRWQYWAPPVKRSSVYEKWVGRGVHSQRGPHGPCPEVGTSLGLKKRKGPVRWGRVSTGKGGKRSGQGR